MADRTTTACHAVGVTVPGLRGAAGAETREWGGNSSGAASLAASFRVRLGPEAAIELLVAVFEMEQLVVSFRRTLIAQQ
jgi:hypothetical protein